MKDAKVRPMPPLNPPQQTPSPGELQALVSNIPAKMEEELTRARSAARLANGIAILSGLATLGLAAAAVTLASPLAAGLAAASAGAAGVVSVGFGMLSWRNNERLHEDEEAIRNFGKTIAKPETQAALANAVQAMVENNAPEQTAWQDRVDMPASNALKLR